MSDAHFFDLPEEAFPFLIEAFQVGAPDDAKPLWSCHVSGPGHLHVPGLRKHGYKVRLRITWGDGTITEAKP